MKPGYYITTKRHMGVLKKTDSKDEYILYINGEKCPFDFTLKENPLNTHLHVKRIQNTYSYAINLDEISFKGTAEFLDDKILWSCPLMKKAKANTLSNSVNKHLVKDKEN